MQSIRWEDAASIHAANEEYRTCVRVRADVYWPIIGHGVADFWQVIDFVWRSHGKPRNSSKSMACWQTGQMILPMASNVFHSIVPPELAA
jgi:hypothetical protein